MQRHSERQIQTLLTLLRLFIWMFLLDCCWLSGVKFTTSVFWMAIDSQTEVLALKIFFGYIPLLLFRKWSKTGTEVMLSRHKLQARASRKPLECLTLIGYSSEVRPGSRAIFAPQQSAWNSWNLRGSCKLPYRLLLARVSAHVMFAKGFRHFELLLILTIPANWGPRIRC